MPENAAIVIKTFRVIALGEFIPYDWLIDPIQENLGSGQDDNSNVLANMGIMLVILVAIVGIATMVILCVKCCKEGTRFNTFFQWVKRKIFWNTVIRFILQSYLKVAISSCFAVWLIKFDSSKTVINAVLAILLLAVISVIPFFLTRQVYKREGSLKT